MDELVERIRQFPIGSHVTATQINLLGEKIEHKYVKVGEVKQEGFFTEGGGWALYNGVKPCYTVRFRRYRKRGSFTFMIGYNLADVRNGW